MITTKLDQKMRVDNATECAGDIKNFCNTEGLKIYATMDVTRAAFAKRTIRSLKNFLFCYMEDYGYKYVHNLPHNIATMNLERIVPWT